MVRGYGGLLQGVEGVHILGGDCTPFLQHG